MEQIRSAEPRDISRIAEILVFTKRMNYRTIFHDDGFSFGVMQVLPTAQGYLDDPHTLERIRVYDDGFVKGMLHVEHGEIRELYVEPFFQSEGIGGRLVDYAVETLGAHTLWVLADNMRARAFYERHGFHDTGEWQYVEGCAPVRELRYAR